MPSIPPETDKMRIRVQQSLRHMQDMSRLIEMRELVVQTTISQINASK